MRVTLRDERLMRDLALSHALGRDQILRLGYFSSITRLNTRLREMRASDLVRVLDTPFHGQMLYQVGKAAMPHLGERVARLVREREPSPRFLRHALSVTEVRLALVAQGGQDWRFEPQLHHRFVHGRRDVLIKPDGLLWLQGTPTFLEVDLGHAALTKLRQKLLGYKLLHVVGESRRAYGFVDFAVLFVTTSAIRQSRLLRQLQGSVPLGIQTFANLGITLPGGWS